MEGLIKWYASCQELVSCYINFSPTELNYIFWSDTTRFGRYMKHHNCRSFNSDIFSYIFCQIWQSDEGDMVKLPSHVQEPPFNSNSNLQPMFLLFWHIFTPSCLIKLIYLPLLYNISEFQCKINLGSRDITQLVK